MARLRLRIEMNKGGVGISMEKLAAITHETQHFLRMLTEDIDLKLGSGGWIAKDFDNKSVDYTAEYVGLVSPIQLQACKRALKFVMGNGVEIEEVRLPVRRATVLQYAKIAKPIDPDEAVHFGLFKTDRGKKPSERFVLSKERALAIEEKLGTDGNVEYLGSIQGVIHSVIIEGKNASFNIRELYTESLIKCFYDDFQYTDLVNALKRKEAVVHVSGWVTASRIQRKPLWVRIEKIKPAEEYREGDLEHFIGSAPNLTESPHSDDN